MMAPLACRPLGVTPRRMVLLLGVIVGVVLMLLAWPRPADAHPLGNFTVNRYARIEPAADAVRIAYAIDMAEIPTFQEMSTIDRDRDGTVDDLERTAYLEFRVPELLRNLRLTVDGKPLPLRAESSALTFTDGQGGLQILRIDAALVAELPSDARGGVQEAAFRDSNYDNRVGWREVVVRGTEGAAIRESSAPPEDVSDALRSYPVETLSSPLNVREARFRFEPGIAGASASQDTAARVAERTNRAVSPGILSRFAESAATKNLTAQIFIFSLVAAVFWGAMHALGPGHGKTVVAAYLVGSRGTAKHAAFLGLTVTATHTASTYLLGFITLFASAFIVPERLFPVLSLASGLMVIGMGLTLLAGRLRGTRYWPFAARRAPLAATAGEPVMREPVLAQMHGGGAHSHGFGRSHSHGPVRNGSREHDQGRTGANGGPVTWRSLLALGIYGGMIPCPTAIVVLLVSISLNRVEFGLLLVIAFSLGLAGVLMGIGFALVYARQGLSRVSSFRGTGVLAQTLPVMSAAVVVVAGILITLRAAGQSGLPLV